MNDVISIHEAKTNLSKLVKQAKAGKTIYIGAYGNPEAIIAPMPEKQAGVKFGGLSGYFKDFDYEEFQAMDKDIPWDV